MVKAVINGEVIARSTNTVVVEHKHYFPLQDVRSQVLKPSHDPILRTWKGKARYYHVHAGGEINRNGAWYYPDPSDKASVISGRIAFSYLHGIQTIEE